MNIVFDKLEMIGLLTSFKSSSSDIKDAIDDIKLNYNLLYSGLSGAGGSLLLDEVNRLTNKMEVMQLVLDKLIENMEEYNDEMTYIDDNFMAC